MAEIEELAPIIEEGHPLAGLVERIRRPVSEESPSGEDVKYDDAFQELKTQINHIGSVTGEADYGRIVELGHEILAEKSKDLMTAAYLSLGLARTRGADGLAEGLVIIHTLISEFWEEVHPQKPIRRRNALQFVADRFKNTVEVWPAPEARERESLELAQEVLGAIQSFCMVALEDKAPALSGLVSVLRERIRRLPQEPEPEPKAPRAVEAREEPAASSSAPPSSAAPAAPRPARQPSASAKLSSPPEATTAVLKAVAFLREQDATSLVPYRLLRSLRWGVLVESPSHEGGVTRLEAPPEQRRSYLSGLLEKQEYQTLLEEGEDTFGEPPFHFWLDLQRLLVTAAKALGRPYAPLAEVLTGEVALLIRRLPDLPSLRFSDHTPFADGMTREWLDTEVNGFFSVGEASSGAPAGAAAEGELSEAYIEARKLLSNGNLAGALAVMRNGVVTDTSHRAVFRRRLFEGTLCVRGEQHAVGRAILEGLASDIEHYHLDTWEPALAVKVWTQLHACYTALMGKASADEKNVLFEQAQRMLQNIARIDPPQALSLQG